MEKNLMPRGNLKIRGLKKDKFNGSITTQEVLVLGSEKVELGGKIWG